MNALRIRDPKAELARELGVDPARIKARRHNVEHHRSHLASAFYASPYEDAALVSVDGFGDFASAMWGHGRGTEIKIRSVCSRTRSASSTALTQYLGTYGDEYKVMGCRLARPTPR
jgi:carbamoyltransferase